MMEHQGPTARRICQCWSSSGVGNVIAAANREGDSGASPHQHQQSTLSVSEFRLCALLRLFLFRAPLLQPIKRLLQDLQIAGVIELRSSGLYPLLFQRILGRTIDLIEHPKQTGERQIR